MTETKFEPLIFSEKSVEEMIASSRTFYLDVKRRRSVREFSDRPVPDEVIKNAILAAGTSPSGANQQPWHFVVVSNPKKNERFGRRQKKKSKHFIRDGPLTNG
ncbi:nitroreductase family protein [Chloroflexota bacterium]